jgi:hypothetical protein
MISFNSAILGFLRLGFAMALLGFGQAVSAKQTTVIEFEGLGRAEVFYVQLDNEKVIQTGIGAQCAPLESKVEIVKPFDSISGALAEAAANGKLFPTVIVYSNGAQFVLTNVLIVNYSVSGGGVGTPVERMSLIVEDIGPNPRRPQDAATALIRGSIA